MAIHLFEHFYRWECERVLAEWRRLLKPRGRLVLELPDLHKCCLNIVKGRQGEAAGSARDVGPLRRPARRGPVHDAPLGLDAGDPAGAAAGQRLRPHRDRADDLPSGRPQWRDMRIVAEKAP
jgi:hypothetical protein